MDASRNLCDAFDDVAPKSTKSVPIIICDSEPETQVEEQNIVEYDHDGEDVLPEPIAGLRAIFFLFSNNQRNACAKKRATCVFEFARAHIVHY